MGACAEEEDRYSLRRARRAAVPLREGEGYTHIERSRDGASVFGLMGYQVIGFFAPTSRFGSPTEFKAFVDACHQSGIGVILDWVPGTFQRTRTDSHRWTERRCTSTQIPRQVNTGVGHV